jgi:magnesium transporter
MKRLGADPAIATGPFVTTTNDILGLLIYLSLVSIFLVK